MKKAMGIFVLGYIVGALSLWIAEPWHALVIAVDGPPGTIEEEVEAVMYRTRLRHEGCPSNGFLNAYGKPERITAYGIDKCVWPHKCDGCGFINTVYDAQWPKFRREWRAVK